MIITRLSGGLGNQMFQYAAGRRIAWANRTHLKLDISNYEYDKVRSYRLGYFNIIEDLASPEEIDRLTHIHKKNGMNRIYRWAEQWIPVQRRTWIKERTLYFDPDVLKISGNAFIEGNWASEKYFVDITEIIRQEFTLKNDLSAFSKSISTHIQETESVSLHIRRGDYVSSPGVSQRFGFLGLDYYSSAIARLVESVKHPTFFVFSDDIAWVKENLAMECPVEYISRENGEMEYEDLALMRKCKHHIIANSTFSWWGAWLGENQNKIVIAPQRWYSDPDFAAQTKNLEDFIPSTWCRV